MNKFLAIALLALATQMVVAQDEIDSQAALVPDNDEEVSGLNDQTKIFSSFCIKSRDLITSDVKSKTNGAASSVYSLFFNTVQEIGQDALKVQKEGAEQLGNQIANPDTAYTEGDNAYINQGLSRIHGAQIQPKSIFEGFIANVKATGASVSTAVCNKLEKLKSALGLDLVVRGLYGACDQVSAYNDLLKEQFDAMKKSMASEGTNVDAIAYSDVKCVTSQRVNTLEGMCKLAKVAQDPVGQILGRH